LTLSTSAYPDYADTEHIRVAEVRVVTAATTQLEGSARRNQNWNDEVADTSSLQGHLSHIGEWIRTQPASYVRNTGTAATLTGTATNVYIASDPGDIMQFHRANMPAQDMTQYTIDAVSTGSKTFTISGDGDLTTTFYVGKIMHVHNSTGNDGAYTVVSVNWSDPDFIITVSETIPSAVADGTIGDFIIVINDSVTALRKSINLNDITVDSAGATLNNKWFNIVIWGVRNKSGELSYLACNLPSGNSYLSEANAIADASNESVYTIPDDYNGVGFLIARFTIRKSGASFTYNGGTAFVDLRGQFPSTAAGGGGGGAGGGTMSSFTITADSGTPETIVDGAAIDIAGGTGISTVVSATDTITINVDDDYVKIVGDTMTGELQITETNTNTSGTNSLLHPAITANPGSAPAGGTSYRAGFFQALTQSGSAVDFSNAILYGILGQAVHQGTNTLSQALGTSFATTNSGGGTINSAYGHSSLITNSSGTIFNAYSYRVFSTSNSGTMTNNYGIKIEDQSAASNNWALYTGLGAVRFGDTLEMAVGTSINEFSTDGTLAGDSDDAVPTEKAVKTYIDGVNKFEFVEEKTFVSAATTTTFSSLTGTDRYILQANLVDDSGSIVSYEIRINGDASSTDYFTEQIFSTASAVSGATNTNVAYGFFNYANDSCVGTAELDLSDGRFIAETKTNAWNVADSGGMLYRGIFKNTAGVSSITSITVVADQTNGIGVDSTLRLYKVIT
jgi:hypothetical protein